MNKSTRSWKELLIVLSLTTIIYVLFFYDIVPLLDAILFIALLLLTPLTLVFIVNAVRASIIAKKFPPKWTLLACLILLSLTPLSFCFRKGVFSGKKIMEAYFLDDRGRMDLTLHEDSSYILNSSWMFGGENYTGKFQMKGDTIEFMKYPVVGNDFVAKKIIRKGNKIYFKLNESSTYDTTFYYFTIDSIKTYR